MLIDFNLLNMELPSEYHLATETAREVRYERIWQYLYARRKYMTVQASIRAYTIFFALADEGY